MDAETNSNTKGKPERKRKWFRWFAGITIALSVAVFFLVPYAISSNLARKIILEKINKKVNGQVNFTNLSVNWWKGVSLDRLAFKDSTGHITFNVEHIKTRPHYLSLLFGNLSFGKTIIDKPKVVIKLEETEKTGQEKIKVPVEKKVVSVLVPVKQIELAINNGELNLINQNGRTFRVYGLYSDIKLGSYGRYGKFDLRTSLRGGDILSKGDYNFRGNGPLSSDKLSGHITLKADKFVLYTLEPLFTAAGVDIDAEGLISMDIICYLKEGKLIHSHGRISGKNLELNGEFLKNDNFGIDNFDVTVINAGTDEGIELGWFKFESGWLNGRISGCFPLCYQPMEELLRPGSAFKINGHLECDLAKAMSRMPNLLGVREGTQVTSGKLNVTFKTKETENRKTVSGSAKLAGLAGSTEGKNIILSEPVTADVNITSDDKGVNFEKIDFSASFAKITCSGTLKSMDYNGNFDLAKLQSELRQFVNTKGLQITGGISIKGNINTFADRTQLSGSSLIKGLRLQRGENAITFEPEAQIDFSASVIPDKGIIGVNTIQLKGDLGKFTLRESTIPLSDKSEERLQVKVLAEEVDLQKVQSFVVLPGKLPRDMQLYGTANSGITIKHQGNGYQVSSNSKIEDFKLAFPGQKPFQQSWVSLAFDSGVNPVEKDISVSNLYFSIPDVNIIGEFIQTTKTGQTRIQGKAECEYDWAAIKSLATSYLPAGFTIQGQRKDTIKLSCTYPVGEPNKIPANLNLNLTTGFTKAEYSGLNFGATNLELKAEDGILNVLPFSTKVNEGNFAFKGKIDLQEELMVLTTKGPLHILDNIKINNEICAKLLTYLNPVFAGATKISGIADFNSRELKLPLSKTAAKDTQIYGTISITQLRLQGSDLINQILLTFGKSAPMQEFTLHPTQFTFLNGVVSYDNMQIDAGDYPINFKGRIGPESKLDMTVTLPITYEGKIVKATDTATQRISLPLEGTINQPEINLDEFIRNQVMQKGFELLEDLLK